MTDLAVERAVGRLMEMVGQSETLWGDRPTCNIFVYS